jgi:protein N-terminal amidase
MDLNPYQFKTDWSVYEFASHVVETKASLVILNNAWLFGPDAPQRSWGECDEPDRSTVRYWLARLQPLMRRVDENNMGEVIVAICNRVGTEGEAVYAGSSLVMAFDDGEVKMWGPMGASAPGLMIVDTEGPTTHHILL